MQAAQEILLPSCPSLHPERMECAPSHHHCCLSLHRPSLHPERMECAPSHHHCSWTNPHGRDLVFVCCSRRMSAAFLLTSSNVFFYKRSMKCARRNFALLRSRNRPRTFCSRCQGTLTAPHPWPCVRNSAHARSVFQNGPQRQVGREPPLHKRAKTRAKREEKSSENLI